MQIKNEEETIDLLKPKEEQVPTQDPILMLLGSMQEVITACMTLKARVDIIEEHLAYLLSQSSKYKKLLKKAEKVVNSESKENRPIS